MKSITICIPTYNDEQSIQELISNFRKAGLNSDRHHYLLIDDGSKDNSLAIINELAQRQENTMVLSNEKNRGFGYTIKKCLTVPTTELILFISGDYQFQEDAAIILINAMDNSDVDYILGVRQVRNDNLYRKIISKVYNILVSISAKKRIRDVNSVFIVKREAIKSINFKSKSAFIHAELFLELLSRGKKTKFINIPHHARKYGKGSGGKLNVILSTLSDFFMHVLRN